MRINLISAPSFVGFANYSRLFADRGFGSAAGLTAPIALVRLAAFFLAPLLIALIVNEFGRGVRITVRSFYLAALAAFAPVIMLIAWRKLTSPYFGLGLYRAMDLGVPGRAVSFLLQVDWQVAGGIACSLGVICYLAALRGSGTERPSWRDVGRPVLAVWILAALACVASALQTSATVLANVLPRA